MVTSRARDFLISPCWRSFFMVRLVLELGFLGSFMSGKITFPISLLRKPLIRCLPSLTDWFIILKIAPGNSDGLLYTFLPQRTGRYTFPGISFLQLLWTMGSSVPEDTRNLQNHKSRWRGGKKQFLKSSSSKYLHYCLYHLDKQF